MATNSPGGGMSLGAVNRNDLGVMAAGAAAFIASLLPYYGVSYKSGAFEVSSSTNAWHSYATLGLLLLFAAAIVIALRTFATNVLPDTVPWHLVAAALAGLGTLLILIRGITIDSPDFPGVDAGIRWGGWLLILVGIAETVFAVLGMREAGEQLPTAGREPGAGAPPAPPPTV